MRHGEPEGGGYYRGITDDPLTQTGWRQMNDAVAGRQSWEVIISSPLVRCLDFASDTLERSLFSLIRDYHIRHPYPDVHDNNPHDYRYSKDACSPDMCISCL